MPGQGPLLTEEEIIPAHSNRPTETSAQQINPQQPTQATNSLAMTDRRSNRQSMPDVEAPANAPIDQHWIASLPD